MTQRRKIYISPDELPSSTEGLNDLQVAALKERQQLQRLFERKSLELTNLKVTDPRYEDENGRFHPVDAFYYSASTPFIGEVKIRTYNSSRFNTWMISPNKIEALRKWREEKCQKEHKDKLQIQIINFFPDGKCFIWNLDKTPIASQEQKFLYNMNANGERNDRVKDVVYLDAAHALHIVC